MTTIESLREQIVREARLTNLKADGVVHAPEIQRRRLQIFFVALVALVGLLFTTVANDAWEEVRGSSWIDLDVARIALTIFGAWCAFYVYDKEQHLKRLSRLGRDVEALDGALAAGLLCAALVADSVEAVHASLDLDDVVSRVVEQGCALVGATGGALFLVDDDGALQLVTGPAAPAAPGELFGLAMERRELFELAGETSSTVGVPLCGGGDALGVLMLGLEPPVRLGEETRALLVRFAGAAARAIANARRYEAAMFLLDVA